jgi:hypothetical protein|nr:MAG TPA: FeoB-associated Cys-rich membrane protein [Bacteriophage sp.]
MIIIKIIGLLALLYCIKYIYDRFNNKKEDIGLDNTIIMLGICLIMELIFLFL